MQHVSPIREPLVTGRKPYHDITADVCRQGEAKPNIRWAAALAVARVGLAIFLYSVYRT